jgi:hypothetical protein
MKIEIKAGDKEFAFFAQEGDIITCKKDFIIRTILPPYEFDLLSDTTLIIGLQIDKTERRYRLFTQHSLPLNLSLVVKKGTILSIQNGFSSYYVCGEVV